MDGPLGEESFHLLVDNMDLIQLGQDRELRRPRKNLWRGAKKEKGIPLLEDLEDKWRSSDRSPFGAKIRQAPPDDRVKVRVRKQSFGL